MGRASMDSLKEPKVRNSSEEPSPQKSDNGRHSLQLLNVLKQTLMHEQSIELQHRIKMMRKRNKILEEQSINNMTTSQSTQNLLQAIGEQERHLRQIQTKIQLNKFSQQSPVEKVVDQDIKYEELVLNYEKDNNPPSWYVKLKEL